jgi:Lamin Tail Domain/LGFP repeat
VAAADVSIRRVIVNPPGLDVENEVLFVHNGGDEDVDLAGWTLKDTLSHPSSRFTFHFPGLTLLAGADLAVHTGAGTDDAQHLFWANEVAVWNNAGDRATLFDADGTEITSVTWNSPPQEGRVIDTSDIARDIAALATVGGVANPTSEVKWTTRGPSGGEIFWQEFGEGGAAFHAGFPDSRPPTAPQPEERVIRVTQTMYKKYLDLGGPQAMGRPLSPRRDVLLADRGREAHRQEFEGGTLYRSADTGVRLVKGAIRAKWLSPEAGGPGGQMGLPISDERPDSSGLIFQDFERGSIWFTQQTAEVIIGLIIEFTGFHCFGEQQGLGSDEPYFHVSVVPRNPPVDAQTAIDDGMWFTVLPTDGRVAYANVDSRETQSDTNIVFIGRAAPLVVKTSLMEHDEGDPNAFRDRIKNAVAAAGALTAAFVPAASAVATNPQVQALVTDVINGIADTDDDFIGQGEFGFGTRREILDTLRAPTDEEFPGVPAHRRTFLTDGDASYNAYFRLRRWEPT